MGLHNDWRQTKPPLILDGAMGTELERRGVPTPAPLWSAAALWKHARTIETIHREFVDAGADILVANTFRTNPRTLERVRRLADGPDLNRLAVEIAREAAKSARGGRRIFVAASVAPSEDCYRPDLVPDRLALVREHGRLAEWLADARPDLIWIETMNTVLEASIAAAAAIAVELPVAVSWVLRRDGALLGGESIRAAADAILPLSPVCLGLNCTPPAGLTANLPRLVEIAVDREEDKQPFVAAYAHIGNKTPTPGWNTTESPTPEEYAGEAARWVELGATIVGGCCGTTPDHIRALARTLSPRYSDG
ncbi:MAG: homocysteine S-methyltransferase family protein [Planctomycetes bacterium]|nr:homocysteine S-methyltransferase family protein [Planctomycetota bacterium]